MLLCIWVGKVQNMQEPQKGRSGEEEGAWCGPAACSRAPPSLLGVTANIPTHGNISLHQVFAGWSTLGPCEK